MLFSRNFTPISYSLEQIVFGRLLKVRAQFEKQAFVVICVYDPTSPVERLFFVFFIEKLCKTLEPCNNEEYLFVGGDFNCTLESNDHNHMDLHMPSRKWLIHIVEKHELFDVWTA